MKIQHLSTFVTVARSKNMAQTATALNYSHSTIFSHLKALEKDYNTKLYYRTSQGIELTPKGEILLEYAKQLIELYNKSVAAISENKQTSLRISATESGDVCFMHNLLQKFINAAPSLEIEYSKMTSDISTSALTAGTCDVSVICEFDFHPEELCAQYLGTFPLIFVASPSYLSLIQTHMQDSLPPLLGTMKLPVAIKMLNRVGLKFDSCFSSLSNIGDLDTIKQLIHYNQGVALLPKMYVRQDIANGSLIQLPNMRQEPALDAFVVVQSINRIGPYTKDFIDLCFDQYNPQHLKSNNMIS